MMNLLNENNKWELNTHINNLSVNERKDTMVLLFFLNTYGDRIEAFNKLKMYWVDNIYKLPKPSAQEYSSVKTGRYNTLKKMKRIYQTYLVDASVAN